MFMIAYVLMQSRICLYSFLLELNKTDKNFVLMIKTDFLSLKIKSELKVKKHYNAVNSRINLADDQYLL